MEIQKYPMILCMNLQIFEQTCDLERERVRKRETDTERERVDNLLKS